MEFIDLPPLAPPHNSSPIMTYNSKNGQVATPLRERRVDKPSGKNRRRFKRTLKLIYSLLNKSSKNPRGLLAKSSKNPRGLLAKSSKQLRQLPNWSRRKMKQRRTSTKGGTRRNKKLNKLKTKK
jgi:hypothetical protein